MLGVIFLAVGTSPDVWQALGRCFRNMNMPIRKYLPFGCKLLLTVTSSQEGGCSGLRVGPQVTGNASQLLEQADLG